MSNNDFIIENGVLVKYTGGTKNVVIPEGVEDIKDSAFSDWEIKKVCTTEVIHTKNANPDCCHAN